MAKPKLQASTTVAMENINSLESHIDSMPEIDLKFKFFIAELMMLRLFAIVETNIADTAYKLATNAPYLNGAPPKLLVPPRKSMAGARSDMMDLGREKSRGLSWTAVREIKRNTKHILDPTDFFILNVSKYAAIITEMRKVRNYIAHKNSSSRKGFREVVRGKYSANLKLSAGSFLLLENRHSPHNFERFIKTSRILITDIASGV